MYVDGFEEGNISPPSSPTPSRFAERNAFLSGTSAHPWAEPAKQIQNNEESPIIPEPLCIDPRDLVNDSNPASNALTIIPRPKTPMVIDEPGSVILGPASLLPNPDIPTTPRPKTPMAIDEPGSLVPSSPVTPSNPVPVAPRSRTPMAVDEPGSVVLGPAVLPPNPNPPTTPRSKTPMAIDEPGSVLPAAPRLKTPMAVDKANSIAPHPARSQVVVELTKRYDLKGKSVLRKKPANLQQDQEGKDEQFQKKEGRKRTERDRGTERGGRETEKHQVHQSQKRGLIKMLGQLYTSQNPTC